MYEIRRSSATALPEDLKKAGLASRNIVHFLKKVILRCIGLCFHYHHLYLLSRLDQPLIQRIPAGLSSTVACLDITPITVSAMTRAQCPITLA